MFIHYTADGHMLLVAEMSTEHLTNTINLSINRIKELSKFIDMLNNGEISKISALHEAVYGGIYNDSHKDKARSLLKSFIMNLPKYIMEASLRGIDTTTKLQEAFGRSTVFTPVLPTLLLRPAYMNDPEVMIKHNNYETSKFQDDEK